MDKSNDKEQKVASVIELIIENQEAIEQTASLVKKGIAHMVPANSKTTEMTHIKAAEKVEFDGLNKLLSDDKVNAMIKSVVGDDTHKIIGETLGIIESSKQVEAKQKAFADGIAKLRNNLIKPDKSEARANPMFNLALSFIDPTRERLI